MTLCRFHQFHFIFIFFLIIKRGISANSYNILSTNGQYIRATNLPTGDSITIMLTDNGASMIKYNDIGSVTQDLTVLKKSDGSSFIYDKTATVKPFNNSMVILAEANNFHMIDIDNSVVTKTVQWTSSNITSPFISLTTNINQKFFVVAASDGSQFIIKRFDENGENEITQKITSTYNTIECVTYEASPYNILCVYEKEQKQSHYTLYSSSLSSLKTDYMYNKNLEPDTSRINYGQRGVLLDDDKIILCLLDATYFMCDLIGQETSSIKKLAPFTKDGRFSAAHECSSKIEYTSIVKITATTFAVICQANGSTSEFIVSKLIFSNDNFKFGTNFYTILITNTGTNSYVDLVAFSGIVIGMFYNDGSSGRFQFIFYPNCENLILPNEYFYHKEDALDFSSYVSNGVIDTGTLTVKIDPQDINNNPPISGVIIYCGTDKITSLTECSLTNLSFDTGNKEGTISYRFYPVSSNGFELKYCKLTFQVKKCNDACYSCSSFGPTVDDTQCISCDTDNLYYPLYNNTHQCYLKGSGPDHYFLNENVTPKEFQSCYKACLRCTALGTLDDTMCEENKCDTALDYYPLSDKLTQCYTGTINYYYFSNDKYKPCFTGCLTCNTIGTSKDDTQCTSCDTTKSFYPVLGTESICYSESTKKNNYFLNADNKYDTCYSGCATCNTKGTDETDTKCLTCDTNNSYFPLVNNTSQCYLNTKHPVGYYFNVNVFSFCYTGCLTCSGYGTSVSDTRCDSCNTAANFFPLVDNANQCYYSTSKINYYYFDTDKFEKCTDGCLTCDGKGTDVDNTNCLTCDNSQFYYPLTDNSTQCYVKTASIAHYYYNDNKKKFEKCYTGCKKCTEYGTSISNTKCTSMECDNGFAYVVNITTQCYSSISTYPNHLYLHADGTFHYCYESCLTCTEEGVLDDSKCGSCDTTNGFYPLFTNNNQCYSQSTKPENSFITNTGFILFCYDSCKSCNQQGTGSASLCSECKDGYFPLASKASTCLNDILRDQYYENYFLNFDSYKYEKCSSECKKCTNSKSNCLECAAGYYKIIDDNGSETNICLNDDTKPSNYYKDTSSSPIVYRPCYERCVSCTTGGNASTNNCSVCKDGYIIHPLIESQCVKECPVYFYIDKDTQEYKCTTSCSGDYKFILEENKQCLHQCNFPRYSYNNLCLTVCPENSAPTSDDSNVCEDLDVCRKKEMTIEIPLTGITSQIDSFGMDYTQEFLNTDKYVERINHEKNEYTITIFKNEECANSIAFDLLMLDLANCPEKLKLKYLIPNDKPLVILKMDIPRDGQTNQLAYAFYHYITGERLDLAICKEEVITVIVPMNATEGVNVTQALQLAEYGVDVYNSSDPFFNDICFEYTSESGKDVTLEDRRKNYYQNVSFCEEGCEYEGVNLETQEANCSCKIKTDFISEILDNPITGQFLEFINAANFEVLQCYQKVFTFSYFLKNEGGWIILVFMIIQLGFTIAYIKIGLMPIRIYLLQFMKVNPPLKEVTEFVIDTVSNRSNHSSNENIKDYSHSIGNNHSIVNHSRIASDKKFNEDLIENESNNDDANSEISSKRVGYFSGKPSSKQLPIQDDNSINIEAESPDMLVQKKPPKKLMLMVLNHNYINENDNNINPSFAENNSSKKLNLSSEIDNSKKVETTPVNTIAKQELENQKKKKKKKKQIPVKKLHKNVRRLHPTENDKLNKKMNLNIEGEQGETEEELYFSDDELNEMDMFDAIAYDKRPFCTFYWQQLQEKQPIINTFINIDVLEPFTIKAICFFLNAALIFTINGLLYSKDDISAQFYSEQDTSFLYLIKNELSRVVYATMISMVVDFVIGCLFSSKRRIEILVKREKDQNVFREESIAILKSMKMKYIIFLIINFVLMLIFWYYVCAFCNCYPNTATKWMTSSFITWGVILLFPFLLCLAITILRYLGLRYKSEVCYRISNCLTD